MIESLFELKNNSVSFAPQALLIKEFRVLWERDKSKLKEMAILELGFVYFKCDFRSIYRNYFEDEKDEKIIGDLFKGKWKPDKEVIAACNRYTELCKTKSMRLVENAWKAVDELSSYYTMVKLNELDDRGKPVHDANKLQSNIEKLPKLISSMAEAENAVKREMDLSAGLRGGKEKSIFEDGIQING